VSSNRPFEGSHSDFRAPPDHSLGLAPNQGLVQGASLDDGREESSSWNSCPGQQPDGDESVEFAEWVNSRQSDIRRVGRLTAVLVTALAVFAADVAVDRFPADLRSSSGSPVSHVDSRDDSRSRADRLKGLRDIRRLSEFKQARLRILEAIRFGTVMVPAGISISNWRLTRLRESMGAKERLRVRIAGTADDLETVRDYRDSLQAAASWVSVRDCSLPDSGPAPKVLSFEFVAEEEGTLRREPPLSRDPPASGRRF
jgi:hypothetical protein